MDEMHGLWSMFFDQLNSACQQNNQYNSSWCGFDCNHHTGRYNHKPTCCCGVHCHHNPRPNVFWTSARLSFY
jgi:hypothetical protein